MSETNSHIWAFDLGLGSIGEAVRQGNKFLHKDQQSDKGKGKGAKAFARPRARVAVLLVGLLSSRQFGIPTTAGFDLVKRNN